MLSYWRKSLLFALLGFLPMVSLLAFEANDQTYELATTLSPETAQIQQAQAAGFIVPLAQLISFAEQSYGGTILDARVQASNLDDFNSWTYVLKHRAINGRVSHLYFTAHSGKRIK